MIYKGDIIRLFNPSENGLRKQAHMHIVTDKIDNESGCKRSFVVGTTTPTRYVKQGFQFLEVEGPPFKETTYIRLNPMYSIQNVKIKTIARTNPVYTLNKKKETELFSKVNNAPENHLNRDEFIKLNYKFAEPV